jgi:glycerol 3-phosphatase-2
MPLSPLASRYDHLLLDLDGCVWVGPTLTPGTPEALTEARAAGKTLSFLTNGADSSPEDYVRRLWSLGLKASLEEVVTVGGAIQHVLAERLPGAGAFVIGSPAIFRHVADSGTRVLNGTERAVEADVVVVAGHEGFNFRELRTATRAVLRGAELLVAGRDRTFPAEHGPVPGTGAIAAALEYATQRTARSVGKPDRQLFDAALNRLAPGNALMIGDRLDSDLAGAAAADLDCAIVLTGVTTREQAEAAHDPSPKAIAENLHALLVSA